MIHEILLLIFVLYKLLDLKDKSSFGLNWDHGANAVAAVAGTADGAAASVQAIMQRSLQTASHAIGNPPNRKTYTHNCQKVSTYRQ